jgi:GH43 family beta-xylosidase
LIRFFLKREVYPMFQVSHNRHDKNAVWSSKTSRLDAFTSRSKGSFELALKVCCFVLIVLAAGVASAETFQVTNPLIQQRADPSVYKHTDGNYYFTATLPAYDKIELRSAATIQGLATATPKAIWTKHATGVMAAHIWAPEIHLINNKWYIYFAAGSQSDIWAIRIYVLENSSQNPMEGTWTEKGQIKTNWETFSLDATTFEHNGTRYLVWADKDPSTPDINSNLYIAAMTNPWTISGKGVMLSKPEYSWETIGYKVNEGPAVIKKNGKVFIAYSAAATDANYCMGLLTASDTSDLLQASSWTKSKNPVFKSGNGVYGPGHNSFTTSPDGSVDLIVFHGRDYEKITGDALDDPNRHTRVQELKWNSDGTPNFGTPVANGTMTLGSPTPSGGAGAAADAGYAGGGGVLVTGSAGASKGSGGAGATDNREASGNTGTSGGSSAAAGTHSNGNTGVGGNLGIAVGAGTTGSAGIIESGTGNPSATDENPSNTKKQNGCSVSLIQPSRPAGSCIILIALTMLAIRRKPRIQK